MKKGLIFATTLAMALGVGVAVGAHQKKAAEVKAWSGAECGKTWYITGTVGGSSWGTWHGFTLNGDRYEYTFEDNSQVEFKLKNVQSWDGGIEINAGYGPDLDWAGKGWTALTTNNDGNFKTKAAGKYTVYYDKNIENYENGVWAFGIEEYEEPATTYAVTCVLDGQAQSPVQVAEGELPPSPDQRFGKSFSGWCSDEGCTIPAPGVTAATTVYGKFTALPTVTYTIDDSKVSYGSLKVYAYEELKGTQNAAWPGEAVVNKTVTLPNDAKFIINDGSIQTVDITQSGVANDTLRILAATDAQGHNEYEWASDDIPSVYKVFINGIEETMTQNPEPGKESEYVSVTKSFKKGDVLTFKKDDAAYAVSPKEDGAFTKVYASSNTLVFAQDHSDALYLETNGGYLWAGQYDAGVYLVGSFNDWNLKLGYPAEKEAEGDCYFVKGQAFAKDDQVIMVSYPAEGTTLTYHEAVPGNTKTQSEVDFTVMTEGDEKGNVKLNKAGTYDIYCNPSDDPVYYGIEDPSYEQDIPAVEGYYICGNFSSNPCWKYKDAQMMTPTSQDGNVAYHMNFSLAVGDELRVRSYFDDQEPKDRWATVGNEIDTTDPNRLFDKEGDNLKARVAGYYDVYAKYEQKAGDESEQFYFYVSPHAATYEIEMTAVKFAGATKEGTAAQESQLAYAGQVFDPVQPAMSGYALRGYYTDEACTVAYEAHAFEAAGHLYAKYTKAGFYVIKGPSFSIDEAVAMETEGIPANNKAEATIIVEAENETYSFVYYGEDGNMSGNAGLGKEYGYASQFGSNVVFSDTGVYRVYWSVESEDPASSNKIWLNAGSTAYATAFMTATTAVCKEDDKSEEYVTSLHNVWLAQKSAFNDLSDGAKQEIKDIGFDGGDEEGSPLEQMVARYHYIVWKYGSEAFEDFIFESKEIIPPHNPGSLIGFDSLNYDANATIIIVMAIAATSALAFTLLLVFKKKKQK